MVGGVPRLAIPNQTVRRLLYGYLRDAYRDVDVFSVDLFTFDRLLLRDAIAAQSGIRDYMAGEKVIQGFLAAYLSVTDHFVFRSEAELGKGHADICLEPLVARYPHLRHGYVIELKYLKRSEEAGERRVAAAVAEAAAQLRRYLADERLARQYPAVRFTGLAVVFHGWEMAACEAVSA